MTDIRFVVGELRENLVRTHAWADDLDGRIAEAQAEVDRLRVHKDEALRRIEQYQAALDALEP